MKTCKQCTREFATGGYFLCSPRCKTEWTNSHRRGNPDQLAGRRARYHANRAKVLAVRRIADAKRKERLERQERNTARLARMFESWKELNKTPELV